MNSERRTPLRPLPAILHARETGGDPDRIEKANALRRRIEAERRARARSALRLAILGSCFLAGFLMIAVQMATLAATGPQDDRRTAARAEINGARAPIVDRNGAVLATNLDSAALYAHPQFLFDRARTAERLAAIFPDLDKGRIERLLNSGRKFVWIRKRVSPAQMQAVNDIGEPGLQFAPRAMRFYPNGQLAAHVLGGVGYGREDVRGAELVGLGGVERALDDRLSDPERADRPLRLTIDLPVQAAVEKVLGAGLRMMNAADGAAVLIDARSGAIRALASLPAFDPNDRAAVARNAPARIEENPLFNRAVQGVYELGSVFKPFTAALAIDSGLMTPQTLIDTGEPIRIAGFRIRDMHRMEPKMTLAEVVVHSSNVGTARVAQAIGGQSQRAFLERLGLLAPLEVELSEAAAARPLAPARWGEVATMSVGYGHGISVSPLHLAVAYAALVNGGRMVRPTLLEEVAARARPGEQVISPQTSAVMRDILRRVVTEGTATLAQIDGYAVAGKTGTADKPRPGGGYYDDRVIATFAAAFPAEDPAYVLVVMLDEPVETSGPAPRRTAGWTAVPVAAEIIRRTAPLLGLPPAPVAAGGSALLLTSD